MLYDVVCDVSRALETHRLAVAPERIRNDSMEVRSSSHFTTLRSSQWLARHHLDVSETL